MAEEASDPQTALIARLVESLVACPAENLLPWMQENQNSLSLALLQQLKDTCVTASNILEDPVKTDRLTRYALTIAGFISFHDPQALALAQWMRGLWAMYNDVADAVIWFRAALPAYEAINDPLSVARLLSNLVGVLAAVGKNLEAEECYQKAHPFFLAYAPQDPRFLLYLEQNFGWLLHTWGRDEEALTAHNRALELATEYNLSISMAEIQVNLCLTLARLGRLGEVEQTLKRNRATALQAGELVTVARIDMNLGDLYTTQGRPAEALRAFQQATSGFVPMEQGSVLARQATLLRQLGAWPAALRQYDLALQKIEQYALKPFYAETLVNFATCLRLQGERKALRKASKILDQAEALWRELGGPLCLAQVYTERILLALAQTQFAQAFALLAEFPAASANPRMQVEYRFLRAETYRLADQAMIDPSSIVQDYEAVLAYARQQSLHWLRRSALHSLGKLFSESNEDKARSLLEEAAAIDDQLRQTLTLQELKASFHEQANDLYDELIRQAYRQQAYERVLLYAWRAKASAFLDLALNVQNESVYTLEQRQKIDQLRQQIASLRWALAKASEANPQHDRYEEADPELTKLTEQLLEARRQAQQQQTHISTLTLAQLRNALTTMAADALLEYVHCGNEVYGICATKQGHCHVLRLADGETLAELAGNLALNFHSFNALAPAKRGEVIDSRMDECERILQRCYEALVAPFAEILQTLPADSKLLIAPCDVVAMFPFADFWTGEHYWLEAYELETIQSGALLLLPLPTASSYSPAIVIAATSEKIVAVREEAVAVASQIRSSIAFIDTPVLNYLDTLPSPPRMLHIAAHTIARGDAPFFSGIQLHGEVLSVEHCYDLPLWGSELVTLSGCATAGGMESDASLFAFQSALLVAGAKRVICTLWSIADELPSAMMTHFYQLLDAGLAAPTALRQTQRYFLAHPAYCHPALWAAFTCIRR